MTIGLWYKMVSLKDLMSINSETYNVKYNITKKVYVACKKRVHLKRSFIYNKRLHNSY